MKPGVTVSPSASSVRARVAVEAPDRGNAAVDDRDIGRPCRRARAVDDPAAA